MKEKTVTPPMIIGALVLLALIIGGIWAVTMRRGGPEAKAEYAPAYTRQGGQGGASPYGPQSGGGQTGGAPR
jgi:hypothetical protein